jgi:hypothetical protein
MTDWIPLFQTGLWVILVLVLIIVFRRPLKVLIEILMVRARAGAPIKAGPFEVGAPPSILRTDEVATATAEGKRGISVPGSVKEMLEAKEYPPGLREEVYLVHEAELLRQRLTPGSGRYRVRVWVEAYDEKTLEDIGRVTYRLYDDFKPQTVVATEARNREFELWLNVYGEFTIIAYAEKENGDGLWLTRYIDLPGRPPD